MHTHFFRCATLAAASLTLAACAGGSDNADTTVADTTAAAAAVAATGSTTGASTATPTTAGMVDPNTATQQQLMAAGLDSAAAAAVIAGRPHADMRGVDRALARLSADQRKAVYATVWKPIDLNTATDAEILLIPGIGNRMLHEFKEYRPYTSMEQFRREMGKYVDKDEVARLEKYVMIK